MISAVVVAGGKSRRMGMNVNKQYIRLREEEILAITLKVFNRSEMIDEIIIAAGEDEIEYCRENIVNKYCLTKVDKIVAGGDLRQDSVYNGLKSCSAKSEIVLIHDGARPFLTEQMIRESVACAREFGACTVAVPVKDTVKVVDKENYVTSTLNREELYLIQTPQTFKYEMILKAHEICREKGITVTDDTMMIEALGGKVKIVPGNYFNIKLTTPEDLVMGRAIIDHK